MVSSISRVTSLLVVAAVAAAVAEEFAVTRYEDFQRCDSWCVSGRSNIPRLGKGDVRMAMKDSPKDVFPSRLVLQAVEYVMNVLLRDSLVVGLHDGQPSTKSVLEGVLASLDIPLILLDLENPGVPEVGARGMAQGGYIRFSVSQKPIHVHCMPLFRL